MAVLEENLVPGNYYINFNHGICKFIETRYLTVDNQDKKYYVFQFKRDSLYVSADGDNLTRIIECDADFARKKGMTQLKGNSWVGEKTFHEYEAFIKAKMSLFQIESYKNILLDGIKNSASLVISTVKQKHKYPNLNDYITSALYNSTYPDGYTKNIEVEVDSNSNTAIINYKLPSTTEVPAITNIKYDSTWGNLKETKMKDKEFVPYYESVIFQITLRTFHEAFQITEPREVDSIVLNGWVDTIDKKTGTEFTSCILSVMVSRNQFEKINLEQVSPKECLLYLKGIFAGRLHELSPIKPILNMNRHDKRFIEDVEILDKLNEGVNLAEMDWEDFEYLIRELFGKMFSHDGAEVKVTQASRDGGVDAVAFDNDPIRGGKFIIQAKRYNNVVPVSAVRDLYGTVINEGANRGILVTTSYFGNDSREFAKDKPITLIDGSNVVYLLNQYGYKSHIKLRKKQ